MHYLGLHPDIFLSGNQTLYFIWYLHDKQKTKQKQSLDRFFCKRFWFLWLYFQLGEQRVGCSCQENCSQIFQILCCVHLFVSWLTSHNLLTHCNKVCALLSLKKMQSIDCYVTDFVLQIGGRYIFCSDTNPRIFMHNNVIVALSICFVFEFIMILDFSNVVFSQESLCDKLVIRSMIWLTVQVGQINGFWFILQSVKSSYSQEIELLWSSVLLVSRYLIAPILW